MENVSPTPVVILPGIGQSRVLLTDGNGNDVKSAWPLDVDPDALDGLKAPLMKTMLFRRDAGFTDKTAALVRRMLDPIATTDEGRMKNPVRVVEFKNSLAESSEEERRFINRMIPCERLTEAVGADQIYFFAYNSFGEPYETAARLDAFIGEIKARHGCDRVNLLPVSMGGALATAYLDAYGEKEDVKRVMYFVAALDGSLLASDLMEREIDSGNPGGLFGLFASQKIADGLNTLLAMLPAGVGKDLGDKVLTAALETAILNSPSIWSVVPSGRYEALRARYLAAPEKAVLREKTDRFYRAQRDFAGLVARMRRHGASFFACAGYGLDLMPLAKDAAVSSDSIVPLASAVPGAAAAKKGDVFPNADGNEFISPDGTVDVTNAVLRDTSWLFFGQDHEGIAHNDTALSIAARVLSDDSFTDVYTDPALPRFGVAEDNRRKADQ